MKLCKENIVAVLKELEEKLLTIKLYDHEKTDLLTAAEKMLTEYYQYFGEACEFDYQLRTRLDHFEIHLYFNGEKYSPEKNDQYESSNIYENITQRLPKSRNISYRTLYIANRNLCIIRSPYFLHEKNIFKSPMLWAIVLGLAGGFLCQCLPANVNSFILEEVIDPVYSLATKIVAGIAGPVIFFTLLSSISSMNSLSELNSMGKRIFFRFVLIAFCITVATMGLSMLIFPGVISSSNTAVRYDGIIEIILGVVPTNAVSPFFENNMPQLLVLAVASGGALLVLGEQSETLTVVICQLGQMMNVLMRFVYRIMPAIPFLSLFKIVAGKEGVTEISRGWKYILAIYICITVVTLGKLIIVSIRIKTNPLVFIRKLKPVLVKSFVSGSFPATLEERRRIAGEQLGIDVKYSQFWVSMSYSLLNVTLPLELVISVFFVAENSAAGMSMSMLVIAALIILQFSLASVDKITAWTMLFGQLGFSTNFVGVLSLYNLAIANFRTMCAVLVSDLEQIEAAYLMGAVDIEKLRHMD